MSGFSHTLTPAYDAQAYDAQWNGFDASFLPDGVEEEEQDNTPGSSNPGLINGLMTGDPIEMGTSLAASAVQDQSSFLSDGIMQDLERSIQLEKDDLSAKLDDLARTINFWRDHLGYENHGDSSYVSFFNQLSNLFMDEGDQLGLGETVTDPFTGLRRVVGFPGTVMMDPTTGERAQPNEYGIYPPESYLAFDAENLSAAAKQAIEEQLELDLDNPEHQDDYIEMMNWYRDVQTETVQLSTQYALGHFAHQMLQAAATNTHEEALSEAIGYKNNVMNVGRSIATPFSEFADTGNETINTIGNVAYNVFFLGIPFVAGKLTEGAGAVDIAGVGRNIVGGGYEVREWPHINELYDLIMQSNGDFSEIQRRMAPPPEGPGDFAFIQDLIPEGQTLDTVFRSFVDHHYPDALAQVTARHLADMQNDNGTNVHQADRSYDRDFYQVLQDRAQISLREESVYEILNNPRASDQQKNEAAKQFVLDLISHDTTESIKKINERLVELGREPDFELNSTEMEYLSKLSDTRAEEEFARMTGIDLKELRDDNNQEMDLFRNSLLSIRAQGTLLQYRQDVDALGYQWQTMFLNYVEGKKPPEGNERDALASMASEIQSVQNEAGRGFQNFLSTIWDGFMMDLTDILNGTYDGQSDNILTSLFGRLFGGIFGMDVSNLTLDNITSAVQANPELGQEAQGAMGEIRAAYNNLTGAITWMSQAEAQGLIIEMPDEFPESGPVNVTIDGETRQIQLSESEYNQLKQLSDASNAAVERNRGPYGTEIESDDTEVQDAVDVMNASGVSMNTGEVDEITTGLEELEVVIENGTVVGTNRQSSSLT